MGESRGQCTVKDVQNRGTVRPGGRCPTQNVREPERNVQVPDAFLEVQVERQECVYGIGNQGVRGGFAMGKRLPWKVVEQGVQGQECLALKEYGRKEYRAQYRDHCDGQDAATPLLGVAPQANLDGLALTGVECGTLI